MMRNILFLLLLVPPGLLWGQKSSLPAKGKETAGPISTFVSAPIKKMLVGRISEGCVHHYEAMMEYLDNGHGQLVFHAYLTGGYWDMKPDTIHVSFDSTHAIKRLDSILLAINKHPDAVPRVKDFKITAAEKKEFRAFARTVLRDRFYPRPVDADTNTYYAVTAHLDTFSAAAVKKALDREEGERPTTHKEFQVLLVNANNDSLIFNHYYYHNSKAWQLPFELGYKNKWFSCYNLDFARYIARCWPADFKESQWFDNKYLIFELGDWLTGGYD